MSCYLRHLQGLLDSSGIEVNKDNRKRVDEAVHKLLKVKYKNCSPVWKKIKENVLSDEKKKKDFIKKLKKTLD